MSPGDYLKLGIQIAAGAALGGAGVGSTVSSALGLSGTTAAAVSAAVNSVLSQATTSILRGEGVDISLESIIQSAITGGILDTDVAQEALQALETGSEFADAVIQAGVINAATQLVTSGELDAEQLAQAMLQAGLSDQFSEYLESLEEMAGSTVDQLEDFFRGWVPDVSVIEDFLSQIETDLNTDISDFREQFESIVEGVGDVVEEIDEDELEYRMGEGYVDPGSYDYYIDPDGNRILSQDVDVTYDPNDGTYRDADGNIYELGGTAVVNNDGTVDYYDGYIEDGASIIASGEIQLGQDGIYDSDGNLAYYQEEGQWYDAEGNIVDDPALVDQLVGLS